MHLLGKRVPSCLLLIMILFLPVLFPPCATSRAAVPTQPGPEPKISQNPTADQIAERARRLFARDNLVAWCIVPFDSKKRSPEERADMLRSLGFKHFAYDWRAEHIPTFDAEINALARKGITLDAFWVAPGELNRESKIILDVLKRHDLKTRLWVLIDQGADRVTGLEQERRVAAAADKLRPLAQEAAKISCSLALYNHGGWFGEPENQIAIIERLKKRRSRQCRDRLQPSSWPRTSRPLPRTARQDAALFAHHLLEWHGQGR